MLERERTPRTEVVELRFRVPAEKAEDAKRAMAPYVADDEALIPWREVFPDHTPGRSLRGSRFREGLTQAQLAALVGISQRHISAMENDKRTIGKEMAKRFASVLNISYKVFL